MTEVGDNIFCTLSVNWNLKAEDQRLIYTRLNNRKEFLMKALSFSLPLAVILLLFLSACGGSSIINPLNGTFWNLAAINDTPVLVNTSVTVEFTDGKIGGSSGCNSYGGAYKVSGKKFTTDSIVMTLMACMDAGVMEQESAFLENPSECANL